MFTSTTREGQQIDMVPEFSLHICDVTWAVTAIAPPASALLR